jgi:high-affinity K+ transport system ATPase subunit B
MTETLRVEQDLISDLLARLSDNGRKGKEAAIEALAVSTEDDDWRPDELIRQGGITIIRDMLQEKNEHIVYSALQIITAIAAAGATEALIEEGVIASLDSLQDNKKPGIREKVREALALLQPETEEAVISKPQDEY